VWTWARGGEGDGRGQLDDELDELGPPFSGAAAAPRRMARPLSPGTPLFVIVVVVNQSALKWSACRQPRSRGRYVCRRKESMRIGSPASPAKSVGRTHAVAAAAPPYFLAGPRLASLKTSGILSAARFAPRASAAVRPSASRSAADGTSITQPSPWRRAVTLVRAGDDK
jgi:hypothetical protein